MQAANLFPAYEAGIYTLTSQPHPKCLLFTVLLREVIERYCTHIPSLAVYGRGVVSADNLSLELRHNCSIPPYLYFSIFKVSTSPNKAYRTLYIMCEKLIGLRKYKSCSCPLPDSIVWNEASCPRFLQTGVRCSGSDVKEKYMGSTTSRAACAKHGDEGYSAR